MDEEKTIDDEKTVDEVVEEMTGDMKEFEPVAFDEAVKETEPERKDAPILRDAPDPADMNMIHKHVDNFLAKIAGETPIDENVRDSTEYWLKRLADGLGGSTKKIYCHPLRIYKTSGDNQYLLSCLIFNNDPTPLTLSTFKEFIDKTAQSAGTNVTFLASGYYWTDANRITSATYIFKSGAATYGVQGGNYANAQFASVSGTWAEIFGESIFDDGVNAIN